MTFYVFFELPHTFSRTLVTPFWYWNFRSCWMQPITEAIFVYFRSIFIK